MRTRLTELFGLRYPIVSAPMVFQSGGDLAGAVSKAGGLGSFGAVAPKPGAITLSYIADNLARVRQTTDKPFGIGFITPFIGANRPNFDYVLSEDVPVIMLSFGDPRPWISLAKARGRAVLCQVQTMEEARIAVGEGADGITVQGEASGGHCGERSLLPFLAEAADAFPQTPVMAAGGLGDGRTLAAVLAAGASGAWIGTAFRAVTECAETPEEDRQAILRSDGRDTVRSSVVDIVNHGACGGLVWPGGIAMRTQINPLLERWHGDEDSLAAAVTAAPEDFADLWDNPAAPNYPRLFGEAAQFVSQIETAEDFIRRITDEAEHLLARWNGAADRG
ncbi:MAG: nitronate monooxygenase [Limimaricola sp.]|uniref:nitronate monooxygenase n=1 Tax=Limimaricola sp. TaxID=2211665 RepID=UPI001D514627|nr:nitronate monooxygenase [Limimaricola sp.]MBI1417287.1 nitronate monooxygenase [Limimaricola sp.]